MKYFAIAVGAIALSCSVAAAIDPIEARKEGFKAFKKELGAIKKIVEAGDASQQAALLDHAKALDDAAKAQWSKMAEHFPAGSYQGETDALPAIWEKATEFQAAIDKQRTAINGFVAAAQSADPAQWKSAFGQVGGSCKNCHESFKKD
ncbi:cytochrome c [Permianibacter sp. IMCC34836]|uniref:c-type cytochrome n=1 Tax=Permianibacter fluminis TaxID=2738515 RepID=UPI001556555C|nr:cytochrome c [Permianibacter fluminis]NQD38168.1 cytochrome c [Permianibacter fluminis]